MSYARPVSLLSRLRAIESGETTAQREYDAFAARAAMVEPAIAAFAAADWSATRAAIAQMTALPLRGLPIGVKDIYDTIALPTCYGSPVFRNFRPARDAAMVGLLSAAGASIPVKTATTEFAFLEPSATRNPWSDFTQSRRLVGWLRRSGRSGHAASGDRHPDGGFDTAAGFILWNRWLQTVVRAAADRGREGFRAEPRHGRPVYRGR